MKSKKMLTVIMIITIISAFLLSGVAQAAEPKVLKAITVLGENNKFRRLCVAYANDVKRWSNGQLIIDIIGGSETIPSDNQIFALKSGVVDIAFDLERVSSITPVYTTMILTGMKPWEQRAAGLYDWWREVYTKEADVYWLGQAAQTQWFVFALNKKVTSLADFAGLKIRSNAPNAPAVEALGAVPVVIPFSDIYSAMDRGVIDGFFMTTEDWVDNGWQEVTKYILDIRFLEGAQTGILVSMNVWNSLSEQEKNWLQEPLIVNEPYYYAMSYENYAGGEDRIANAGVEFISWSLEDRKKAIELAREGVWNYVKANLKQEYIDHFTSIVKGLSK
jgi:TRAP-type C4-dicarboxylate transport system substrate-binding protein